MSHEARTRNHQQMKLHQQRRHRSTAETHEEEVEEVYKDSISLPYRRAYDMAEKFATTRIGQFVMGRGDQLLKTIESTAKWSLPQEQMEGKLQRPLPWVPFLMIIIMLRLSRVWISIGALMIGNAPVQAQDVVYFVQTRRRKLRALRLRGLKERCRREAEAKSKKLNAGQSTFVAQMKRIFASAICRPGQHREPERRIMIHCGKEVICLESDSNDRQVAKRPRGDDCEADMTIDELLNKYADDKSEDDSDFVPDPEDENDESITSSEASDTTEEEATLTDGAQTEKCIAKVNESEKRRNRGSNNTEMACNQSVEFRENGNGEPINVPKPIAEIKQENSSDTDTNEKVKTPHGNGPSNNNAENRETDVAFKFVLTPPGVENDIKLHNTPRYKDVEKSYKGTPGHISAAKTQVLYCSTLEARRATAPESFPTIDFISSETSSDAHTSNGTVDKKKFQISNFAVDSNSNCNSSSTQSDASSSSLDSSIQKEEKNSKNDLHATATSTPNNVEAEGAKDSECDMTSSVSSSDDDFYSPIGSPPDFNAYQNRVSFNLNNNMPLNHNQFQKNGFDNTTTEPQTEDTPTEDYKFYRGSAASTGRRNQNQSNQGSNQHRYRGRNRR